MLAAREHQHLPCRAASNGLVFQPIRAGRRWEGGPSAMSALQSATSHARPGDASGMATGKSAPGQGCWPHSQWRRCVLISTSVGRPAHVHQSQTKRVWGVPRAPAKANSRRPRQNPPLLWPVLQTRSKSPQSATAPASPISPSWRGRYECTAFPAMGAGRTKSPLPLALRLLAVQSASKCRQRKRHGG
jgi:hypothetical protein